MNVTSWGMRVDLTIAHFDRGQFGMGVFNGARKLSRVAGASGSDFLAAVSSHFRRPSCPSTLTRFAESGDGRYAGGRRLAVGHRSAGPGGVSGLGLISRVVQEAVCLRTNRRD